MTIEIPVLKVVSVDDHPNADRLSVVKLQDHKDGGYPEYITCVANKIEGVYPRYKSGDLVAWLRPGAILPEWLLKKQDMWDYKNNKGYLGGENGNVVQEVKLRGIVSEGTLYPLERVNDEFTTRFRHLVERDNGDFLDVVSGEDVAQWLGIQ